jgi:ABC-type transport system involved in cytochrome bd biosynthesis fused ATPase/permease subunit
VRYGTLVPASRGHSPLTPVNQEMVLAAVEGRTVPLITHRPVAAGTVDQVLRRDDGASLNRVAYDEGSVVRSST